MCVLDNLFKPRERSISGREMQLRSRRWVLLFFSLFFVYSPSLAFLTYIVDKHKQHPLPRMDLVFVWFTDDRGMKLLISSFPYQKRHLIKWWLPIMLSFLSFFKWKIKMNTAWANKSPLSCGSKKGEYVKADYQWIWIFSASFGHPQKRASSSLGHLQAFDTIFLTQIFSFNLSL